VTVTARSPASQYANILFSEAPVGGVAPSLVAAS
jgi:hypothetical protein